MSHRTLAKLLVAALLAGTTTPLFALEPDKLTVWVGTNRDIDRLRTIGERFTEELGIPVEVVEVDPLPDKFQQAAATGDGPDLAMHAHDRLGEWSGGGLIAPVSPSAGFADGVIDTAMDAVTFDGRVWGWPVAVEAVGLVYNKALVDAPPATFEELEGQELEGGVPPILWDYTNTYFTFPLMAANGGFAFEKVDGSYDGSVTGVNNDGAVEGATLLETLIESGTMPKGVDYGIMDGRMTKGEVGMVINGPWAWGNYESAGIDIGVAPLPTVGGEPAIPFVGVQAFALNAASPNKDLAAEFIENYVLSDEGLATWNAGNALGTLADASAAAEQDDPKVATTLEIAKGRRAHAVEPRDGRVLVGHGARAREHHVRCAGPAGGARRRGGAHHGRQVRPGRA